ncbi:MAG: thermonuclease family protein [Bauldia sp.]
MRLNYRGIAALIVAIAAALWAAMSGDRAPSVAPTGRPASAGAVVAARNVRVVDGDTFNLGGERIRIEGIDAPETHPPNCENEARLGERATERLRQLLAVPPLLIDRRGKDTFGRTLARVSAGGVDVGAKLVSERLAHVYVDHKLPWC